MHLFRAIKRKIALCAVLSLIGAGSAHAGETQIGDSIYEPMTLFEMQEVDFGQAPVSALDIREDAQRDAAISFGARGGLARRTFEIRREIGQSTAQLTSIYDFRRLLIAAPNGLAIEPPIVTEALHALIISDDGQEAAVSDRVVSIIENAKIVSTARDWRQYLERNWGDVELPPQVLLPRTEAEREKWRSWVATGWDLGKRQADEIFQIDLDRLNRDFTGMVRYRELLAQGMISEPFPAHEVTGVTGTADKMYIGGGQVNITGPSELELRPERWIPIAK